VGEMNVTLWEMFWWKGKAVSIVFYLRKQFCKGEKKLEQSHFMRNFRKSLEV